MYIPAGYASYGSIPYPQSMTLEANSSDRAPVTIDADITGNAIFAEAGTYSLRGWHTVNDVLAQSAPIQIQVQQLSPIDVAAYKSVKENHLYLYFHPDSATWLVEGWRVQSGQKNPLVAKAQLEALGRRYPNSTYSVWATLASLSIQQALVSRAQKTAAYVTQSPKEQAILEEEVGKETYNTLMTLSKNSSETLHNIQQYLERLATESETRNPRLSAYSWYEAGRTSGLLADSARARQDFARADAIFPKEPFLLTTYNARRMYNAFPPKDEPEKAGRPIIEELTKQGYDVPRFSREFSTKHPDAYKQYASQLAKLAEDKSHGVINLREYYVKGAEILRTYIDQYGAYTKK